jgi:hypothetical protein
MELPHPQEARKKLPTNNPVSTALTKDNLPFFMAKLLSLKGVAHLFDCFQFGLCREPFVLITELKK